MHAFVAVSRLYLANLVEEDLPGIVQRMEERIDAEAPVEERDFLWMTVWLLLGLKYSPEFSRQLLKGVLEMKESSTYQSILEEGREEGKIEEARRMLLLLGGKRFGEPEAQIAAIINAKTSSEQLEQLATRLFEVESWQELLQ